MKKLLLSLCAGLGVSLAATAQLPAGSVAPDFTLTDINGQSHHLYAYLDSGYTVILDISAAWCSPCWAAHQSHVLENLTAHYGPNGTITPKKIKVIFLEGESTNTLAQLQGTGTSGGGANRATDTQGDWISGTNFPIIDNATQNTPYALTGFPTFTVICRDHLVVDAVAGYGSAMGVESYWLNIIDGGCPTTAPASGSSVDAKAVPYSGANYFVCAANPTVKFQNYSSTTNITSATIKIYNGANVAATYTWSGNLAPLGVATVSIPSFSPTAFIPYKFDVTVAGDILASNNTSKDSIFKVFNQSNALTTPYSENFDAIADYNYPVHMGEPANGYMFVIGAPTVSSFVGPNGQPGKAMAVDFYDMSANTTTELFVGNFNTASAPNVAIDFDVAYAQFQGTENDKLEILASKDCGTNWTSIWSKAGATLKTANATTSQFIPTASSMWRHESALLTPYKDANMLVKFKGTSAYGNLAWIDNIKITNTTNVSEVVSENSVSVYPNPAKDNAIVEFTMNEASTVQIQVLDAAGRVVSNVSNDNFTAGSHKVNISTANLASGLYNVRIQTEKGSRIERLSVVK